jgi:thioredoxin 1
MSEACQVPGEPRKKNAGAATNEDESSAGVANVTSLRKHQKEINMSKPVEITDANFKSEVLEANVPVLVDVWAEWCMPCRLIAPAVEAVATQYAGKVKVGKMDADRNLTPSQFDIRGIPTLLLFRNGKVVDRIVGAVPQQAIASRIDKILLN